MAGMTVAELVARLRADTGDFESGMARGERALSSFEEGATSAGSSISGLADLAIGGFDRLTEGISRAASGIAAAAVGAITYVGTIGVKYDELLQTAGAGFSTILGSAEKAKMFMAELVDFTKTSPFPKEEFIQAAQQMLGFGIAAKNVIPIFKAVQDAAGGMANPAIISHISDVFARIQSLGHASTMLLNRFSEDGINAFGILAKESGKSMDQIRKEVQAGTLDATTAITLLTQGMEKQYAGGAAKLETTWVGAFDHLKASIRDLGGSLFSGLIDPSIGGDGGLLAKWARSAGDAIRKFDTVEVPAITKDITAFFQNIQDWVSKLPLTKWLHDGEELWQKYGDTIKQFAPVLGAVAASFAKVGLSQIPVLGAFAEFLPIPGPLAAGLIALIASNSDLRDMFIKMASTVMDIVGPALKALIPVVVESVEKIVGVIALLAQQNIGQIADAFAAITNVFVQLLPPATNIVAVLLILATKILVPLISGFAQLTSFMADNYKVFVPLATVIAAAVAWSGQFSVAIQLLQFAFGSAHPVVYAFFKLLDTNPYVQLLTGTLLLAAALQQTFGWDVPDAIKTTINFFEAIPRVIFDVLKSALDVAVGFAVDINQALHDAFDPFQRHSPSLVDQVVSGTALITTKYGDMVRSIVPGMREAQKAMEALNAAAGPMEAANKVGDLNKLKANLVGTDNAGAIVASYQALDAQVVTLTKQISPLQDALAKETNELNKQQKALDKLNLEYQAQQKEIQKTQQAVTAATKTVSDLTTELSAAQQKLQDYLNTPLRGTAQFDDAMFANSQAIAALQFKLNKLTLSGDTSDQVQILTDKIARLNTQGQQIALEKQLTLGPQQHAIDKLKQTTPEMSGNDIIKGVTDANQTVKVLTDQLKPAQDNLKGLQNTLDAQTTASQNFHDSIDKATTALDAQKAIVDDLKSSIADMTAALDGFAKREAEIMTEAATRFQQLKAAKGTGGGSSGAADNSNYSYPLPAAPKIADMPKMPPMPKIDTSSWTKQFKELSDDINNIFKVLLYGGAIYEFYKFFGGDGQIAGAVKGLGLKFVEFGADVAKTVGIMVTDAARAGAAWVAESARAVTSFLAEKVAAIADFVAMAASAVLEASIAAAAWIASNPFTLIAAGAAVAVVLIVKYWDDIKQWAGDAWQFIKDHWDLLLEILTGPFGFATVFIIDHFHQIIDFVTSLPGRIVHVMSTLWNGFMDGMTHARDWIGGRINDVVNFVTSLPGRIAGAAGSVFDTLKRAATTAYDWVGGRINDIVNFVGGLPGRIKSLFEGLADIIKSPFTIAFGAIKTLWNNTVGGFGFSVPDWVPGIGGKGFHIPRMHTGGIVPGGFGAEPIYQLQGGEGVFTSDQMKALGGMLRNDNALMSSLSVMQSALSTITSKKMTTIMPAFPQVDFKVGPNGVSLSDGKNSAGITWTGDVIVQGSVVTEQNLVERIHDGLIQKSARNAGLTFERQSA